MDDCALYRDPELYDMLFSPDNIAADHERRARVGASARFYVEEVTKRGGRALELGCGTGRIAIPIAKSGIEITGLDLSASMLALARRKAAEEGVSIEFIEADMRFLDLGTRFSTILIPGNSLLHLLTIEDLRLCLNGVRRHLAPGGRLVFDISKWDLRRLTTDPNERHPVLRLSHSRMGEILVEESSDFDSAAQVRHVRWYLSTAQTPDFQVADYTLRVIFPQELPLLVESAGLRLDERYGELPRQPFDSTSPRQVCVCSAAAA